MTFPEPWERRTATLAEGYGPLPVKWDGLPVTWRPWEPWARVFICDRSRRKPAPPERCPSCGDLWMPASATGLMRRPGDRWDIASLVAWRCTTCGHDQVFDRHTGESWDLEPDDYGPDGSVDPGAGT